MCTLTLIFCTKFDVNLINLKLEFLNVIKFKLCNFKEYTRYIIYKARINNIFKILELMSCAFFPYADMS